VRASASWLAHLRAGGTTPWAQYALTEPQQRASGEAGPILHTGAQQLEVLRRLNELGRVSPALAERVLRADLTGRGHAVLGLVGEDQGRFGTPPVDPAELPHWELLRVVVGLLAEDVVRAGVPPLPPARRTRLRRVRYRLAGDPWLAAAARPDLEQRGFPQGGAGAVAFVVGRDLPGMLTDLWTWRSLVNDAPPWESWLARLHRADELPAEADLAREAGRWAELVGMEQVRIVVEPALLPHILRAGTVAQPPRLSADAVELARAVGPMVGLFAGDARPELMVRGLVPRLASMPGTPLSVPERWQPWVDEQADRVRREVSGGHYAVLGNPDLILPATGPTSGPVGDPSRTEGVPSEPAVLALALRILLENDPDSRVEGA